MKTFKLNKQFTVICERVKTRMAFKHTAVVLDNGSEIHRTKVCYLNRTWESYEFQSVLHQAINGTFPVKQAKRFIATVDKRERGQVAPQLKMVAAMCALGDLLCSKPEEQNAFKKRILGTLPGMDFPDDFDALPEEEKARRLNAGAAVLVAPEKVTL